MASGKLIAALLLFATLLLSGCTDDDDASDRPRGRVVFAEVSPFPENLFPIIGAANSISVANILVRIFPTVFRLLPDLTIAHDSELLTREPTLDEVDGKQVNVYSISPDAVWSDGVPITADDFAFVAKVQSIAFLDICPDSGILSTVGYDQMQSIEGSDDGRTVTVTYATPFADWQGMFSAGNPLLPAHLLDSDDPAVLCETITSGWPSDQGISENVSGGPWQLKRENIDPVSQAVTLTPNENYWGDQPNLSELVHQTIGEDPGAGVSGLENGELQMIYSRPQVDIMEQLAALGPAVVSTVETGLVFEHLDFNSRNVHLADVNVRRAIGLALDRKEIVDQTVGQLSEDAEVLNNRIFLNNQPQYQDTAPEEYNAPDPAAASDLLEYSGYALGADGIYAHPDRGRLSLSISTVVGHREQTILVIIPQLARAGIEIISRPDPNIFALAESPTSLEAGGFDIALFAWYGGPFPGQAATVYRSLDAQGGRQGQNYTNGGSPEVDALYDLLLREPDRELQAEIGNRIDAQLWANMYTIPLYQEPTLLAYDAGMEGVEHNPSQVGPLWNSEEWTLT